MEREQEVRSDLIDMGAATSETRGAIGSFGDEVLRQLTPGLSNE